MAVPIWNPDLPAVSFVESEEALAAWQEFGVNWLPFPATPEQAEEVLGRPVPSWEHLNSDELVQVAQAVTEAQEKAARKASRKKTHDDAPSEPDQPQDAAEHQTEGES